MAKYNLIFFLSNNSIATNEVGTNGCLQTVKVKGFKKYEYKSPADFEQFFRALKDEYNINSFVESDFCATVLNMGVPEETAAEFEKYLGDCKKVNVLNGETSRTLMEGKADDSEGEELEKKLDEAEEKLAKKDEEINSLKEQREIEMQKKTEKITQLESECKSLQDKVAQVGDAKETFMSALFPVSGDGKSVSSSIAAKIIERKFNDGDEVKKGDIILVTEFMGIEFEISSPADGFVFFHCKNDALTLGQRLADVRERRYELVKEVIAQCDGTMPGFAFSGKMMKISMSIAPGHDYNNLHLDWSGEESYSTFFSNDRATIDIWRKEEVAYRNSRFSEIDIRSYILITIYDECTFMSKRSIMFIPCVEPNAPVKRGQKIAEIVKEYEDE